MKLGGGRKQEFRVRHRPMALVWSLSLVVITTLPSFTLGLSTTTDSPKRCAVVGVGVLGTSLCRQILNEWSDANVVGITKTTNNHASIREQVVTGSSIANDGRFSLITSDEDINNQKFANVVFCAPPSGFEDYPAAVQQAADRYWEGPEHGVFVFTSSGSIYGSGEGGTVTETSALADASASPRVARLMHAEEACRNAGGCCLRLAGLYNLQRGAHNFWLTSGKPIASSPDGLINLLHYDDAASACLAAIKAGPEICRGKAFLISDGHPLSRYGICESALKARVYQKYVVPTFATNDDKQQSWAQGKIYDGSASNAALKWKPKYNSFDEFMESHA